jgi:acyl-lipid omega-6 desaturase (Delta-12 desaturase)
MSADRESVEVAEMKKYVQSYGKPDDKRAVVALGISFAYEALAIALIHWGWGVLGWTIHMLNNVRFFIQFHDMAHFSFFSSMALNTWAGKLIGIYTHFPFNAWRDGHNHHHKHFGNLDRIDLSQTILFTKKQY